MHVWKTLKVFVSSTFKDLELERDKLAQVFQTLQEHIFDRRLHLIPYDLRWREKRETDLVKWCMEMVSQSHYFVGILGYRYGWRPPCDSDGKENTRHVSITEMEIEKALSKIPKDKRFFCLGDFCQYSDEQLRSESDEDKESIQELKQKLRQSGESVFDYKNTQELLDLIYSRLKQTLDSEYPPGKKAQLESYSRNDALKEIIQEKRKGFVGQKKHLQILKDFCVSDSEKNYLVIHAVAGIGKSALVAQFINEWVSEVPTVPVIIHYMSMAGDSRSVWGIMQNIGEQLKRAGFIKDDLEALPERLVGQVRNSLQNSEQKFVLVIDGLDEIDEEGEDLVWLPQWLPPKARIIITTRPVGVLTRLREFPLIQETQLPPLGDTEIQEIIRQYKIDKKLNITPEDMEILAQRASGSPLFLKVALDEMLAGGLAVGQLAETVESLFRQILTRLQKEYGEEIINTYLGLIAASRSGVAEAELREIFSQDFYDLASDDFLLRLENGLANFVIQREKLLKFFHPEFERSVKMLLGKGKVRLCHRRLASYFGHKGSIYERTLSELLYQTQWGEEYENLLRIFGDINFLEAKCCAGMLADLRSDLGFAISSIAVPVPSDIKLEIAPGVLCTRETLQLLGRILDFDYHFLARHPGSLMQSLWNLGYWHDSPEAAGHYIEAGDDVPWNNRGPKLCLLVEHWRNIKEQDKDWVWLKSLRPLPDRLNSPMLKIFRGHGDIVTGVVMNSGGDKIVSSSWDKTVRVWDVASGQTLLTLKGHEGYVSGVGISEDNLKIVSGSEDKTVRMWDAKTGKCLLVLRGHDKEVSSVHISRDGSKIASGAKDKTVRIWDTKTGECLFVLKGHTKLINSVYISHDNKRVVSGAWDNTIRVWDTCNGQCLLTLTGHDDDVKSVSMSDDGNKIVSGSKDCTARIWDASTGQCLNKFVHKAGVQSVSMSADGQKIATGVYGGVRLWDCDTGQCLLYMEGHESAVFGIFISHDGKTVISGSSDKTIRMWDVGRTEYKLDLDGHEDDVRSICLSKDGKNVVSGSKDKDIRVWETKNGKCVRILKRATESVRSVYIGVSGDKLVSGGDDKAVSIWDMKSGQSLRSLDGHEKMVLCVFMSNDERRIVSGSRDKTVRLWDVQTGECLLVLEGHKDDVRSVCLSPDNKIIVSGSEDRTVRIWNASSGECLNIFSGHKDGVISVSANEDATIIISSSRDNTVRFWDFSNGKCLKILEGYGDVSQLSGNTPYYALAQDIETLVAEKKTDKKLAFFPTILRQAAISEAGIIGGYAGVHTYILELRSKHNSVGQGSCN